MQKPKTLYSKESERLSQWLQAQREASGLSLRDVGEKLGWHHSIIGKIEQGQRRIDVIEYLELCQAINANPTQGLNHLRPI